MDRIADFALPHDARRAEPRTLRVPFRLVPRFPRRAPRLHPGSAASRAAPAANRPTPPAPFTETLPRSTVTLILRPLPAGRVTVADLRTGISKVVERRTLLDRRDGSDVGRLRRFLLRLDVPEDRRTAAEADTGPDSVTRPTPPYAAPDRGWGHAHFPAIGVTSNAADRYCRWLSEKTGRRYRLPTVAEWRLACRSGEGAPSEGAPSDRPLEERAWFAENADEKSHPVAAKAPNAAGLYDLLGNVAEWCTDADGRPVVCGGSYQTPRAALTCNLTESQQAAWTASDPAFPRSKWWLADAPFVGFRLVCEGPSPRQP